MWDPKQQQSDFGTADAPVELYTGVTYTADPPSLMPTHSRFIGYANADFGAISYHLDVAGSVDLGCGSVVTGDTTDGSVYADTHSYSLPSTRKQLYDSKDAAFSFSIQRKGNVTFSTCMSQYATSLVILNSTSGKIFNPFRTVEVLTAKMDSGTSLADETPSFSRQQSFKRRFPWQGGCGNMSLNAEWTLRDFDPGSYTVVVDGAYSWEFDTAESAGTRTEGKFVLEVTCDAPDVLTPSDRGGGMLVNPRTGAITGSPKAQGNYSMVLSAVDGAGTKAVLQEWAYTVKDKPKFDVVPGWEPEKMMQTNVAAAYTVGKPYSIPGPKYPGPGSTPDQTKAELFVNAAQSTVSYRLDFDSESPQNFLVDTNTGKMLFQPTSDDQARVHRVALVAVDAAGEITTVRAWNFTVNEPEPFKATEPGSGETWDPRVQGRSHLPDTDRYWVNTPYIIPPPNAEFPGTVTIIYTLDFAPGPVPQSAMVDTNTGKIQIVPEAADVGVGEFNATLHAVDGNGAKVAVRTFAFVVVNPAAFTVESFMHYIPEDSDRVNNSVAYAFEKDSPIHNYPPRNVSALNLDPATPKYYGIRDTAGLGNSSYQLCYLDVKTQLPPIRIVSSSVGDDAKSITFTTEGAPDGFFVDPKTGEMLGNPRTLTLDGVNKTKIYAVDRSGARALLETIHFRVVKQDTADDANGPHKQKCSHGKAVDGTPFDSSFECDCSETAYRGDNCEVLVQCSKTANEIFIEGVGCSVCQSGSKANDAQDDCLIPIASGSQFSCTTTTTTATNDASAVPAIWRCPRSCGCSCKIPNRTKAIIDIECNGKRLSDLTLGNIRSVLPPQTTKLTLVDTQKDRMHRLLANLAKLKKERLGHVNVFVKDLPNQEAPLPLNGAPAIATSTTGPPSAATCIKNVPEIPDAGHCSLVFEDTSELTIGVCFSTPAATTNGTCAQPSQPCQAGSFADLIQGECRKCARGGFYNDRAGRVGAGSHCGCSPCQPGTFSNSSGADKLADCEVCPSGTDTNATAGYRACRCLRHFSRTDRFGPCESCLGAKDRRGISCKGDVREVKKGFYWAFSSAAQEKEYADFACNLRQAGNYNRSLSKYSGSFPKVYPCPTKDHCEGGVSAKCRNGTTGPLCAVCDPTQGYIKLTGQCRKCYKKEVSWAALILVAMIFLAFGGGYLYYNAQQVVYHDDDPRGKKKKKPADNPDDPNHGEESSCCGKARGAVSKWMKDATVVNKFTVIKILQSYCQVQSSITGVYTGVEWPTAVAWFGEMISSAGGGPQAGAAPGCIDPEWALSAHGSFLATALAPIGAGILILVFYTFFGAVWWISPKSDEKRGGKGGSRAATVSIAASDAASEQDDCYANIWTRLKLLFGPLPPIKLRPAHSTPLRACDESNVLSSTFTACATKEKDGCNNPAGTTLNVWRLRHLRAQCLATFYTIYFFLYSSITVNSVRLLKPCHEICAGANSTGSKTCTKYLHADYSIDCSSSTHRDYTIAAGFAFAVYSLLLPMALVSPFIYSRWHKKPNGNQDGGPKISTKAENMQSWFMRGVRDIYKPYRKTCRYWEFVDLVRKLCLTGLVVFIGDGTSFQIALGAGFAVVALTVHLSWHPFKNKVENLLATVGHIGICVTLIFGLLLRATEAEEDAEMDHKDIDENGVGGFVTAVAVIILVVTAAACGCPSWCVRPACLKKNRKTLGRELSRNDEETQAYATDATFTFAEDGSNTNILAFSSADHAEHDGVELGESTFTNHKQRSSVEGHNAASTGATEGDHLEAQRHQQHTHSNQESSATNGTLADAEFVGFGFPEHQQHDSRPVSPGSVGSNATYLNVASANAIEI